jgi:hypothetical protein
VVEVERSVDGDPGGRRRATAARSGHFPRLSQCTLVRRC